MYCIDPRTLSVEVIASSFKLIKALFQPGEKESVIFSICPE
jgi:hypothetical protein